MKFLILYAKWCFFTDFIDFHPQLKQWIEKKEYQARPSGGGKVQFSSLDFANFADYLPDNLAV